MMYYAVIHNITYHPELCQKGHIRYALLFEKHHPGLLIALRNLKLLNETSTVNRLWSTDTKACCFAHRLRWKGVNWLKHSICVKVKGLDTCYSDTYMSQTRDQQRFTISEVAADWHEPMVPQRIMWTSIAHANGQLHQRCS